MKHLATECKFGEAMRIERLRDRLVSGIRDSKMIMGFLKGKLADLSFDLAVEKCLAKEQANKDMQALQGEREPGTYVHLLDMVKAEEQQSPQKTQGSRGKNTRSPKPCYRCTGFHGPNECSFIKERCYH